MLLLHFLWTPAFLLLFLCLFFRQLKEERFIHVKKDLEGDLHMLREMRGFYLENGLDAKRMEDAILEMEERLRGLKN